VSSLLVDVVQVGEVRPHTNADRLEIVPVKGWQCVVQKGQFNVGDTALFLPIDAIPPAWMIEEYGLDYLKDSSQGARIRTVRLRGEISQGLLLTVGPAKNHCGGTLPTSDLASRLGIAKWEPPEPAYQRMGTKGKPVRFRPNPNFSRYCDPENIKNYPDLFKPDDLVVVTEKVHGTNFRAGWVPRYYGGRGLRAWFKRLFRRWLGEWEWCVGSRNVHLVGDNPQFYAGNVYHKIAQRYALKTILPKGWTIYGEIYGPGIQGNYNYGLAEIDVVFFDLRNQEEYSGASSFERFCHLRGLPTAPLLHWGRFAKASLSELASGRSRLDPNTIREGCVVKTVREEPCCIGRKILKCVNEDYLLQKCGTEFH
jgi:RNA ligase (TIGR02306 family)